MKPISVSSISFLLMVLPGLLLVMTGYGLSEVAGLLEILASAIVAFFPSNTGKGIGKYIPLLIMVLSFVASEGYVQGIFAITPVIAPSAINLISISMLPMTAGTFLSMVSGTGTAITVEFSRNGFDQEELEVAVSKFSSAMVLIGLGALLISFLIFVVIAVAPELNIGFFPAVILFGVVYILIFRIIFLERKKKGSGNRNGQ